jgi:hypothetical protein
LCMNTLLYPQHQKRMLSQLAEVAEKSSHAPDDYSL